MMLELKELLNKVICGDCLSVMRGLPDGSIKLIYIDPPFGFKGDEKFGMPKWKDTNNKSDCKLIDQFNIKDGDKSYLHFMYNRLVRMRELLSDDGSIYLHCDWHKNHHIRCLMDEVFGEDNFINEIVWGYHTGMRVKTYFNRKHDTLLVYGKTKQFVFNAQYEERIYPFKPSMQSDGGASIEEIMNKDGVPTGIFKSNLLCRDVWDISQVFNMSNEYSAYPTQKPEALLERVIKASSNPGDIVMDCFMGSGTTCAVAQKLGRRWIGCDINQNAVDIASKRLRNIPHTSIIGNTENRVKKAETSTNSSRSGISQSTTKTFVKPTNFDIEGYTKEEEEIIKNAGISDKQHISYVRKLCEGVIDVCLNNGFCYPLLLSEFLERGKFINKRGYSIRRCGLCDNNCIEHKDNPNPVCFECKGYHDYILDKVDYVCGVKKD